MLWNGGGLGWGLCAELRVGWIWGGGGGPVEGGFGVRMNGRVGDMGETALMYEMTAVKNGMHLLLPVSAVISLGTR